MKTQILHIEPHDDNHSITDKMNWGKSERILFVFPSQHSRINRRIDLLLFQRHSKNVGAVIAIVSKNIQINNYASDIGIPIFKSLRQARRLPWESKLISEPEKIINRDSKISLEELKINSKQSNKNQRVAGKFPRAILFFFGVFAFFTLFAAILPSAEIRMSPKKINQEIILSLSANSNTTQISPAGLLPALELSITVEGRDTIEVTGTMRIPQNAAIGEIQFTNLTDKEIYIPIGTIVKTNENPPIRFVTQEDLSLLAESGASGTSPIQAMNPGISSNLPEQSLVIVEGDLGLKISSINIQATTGGTEIESKAPSPEDYLRLSNELEESLLISAFQEAATRIEENDLLIVEKPMSSQIVEKIFSPPNPQPVRELSLQYQIEYKILYISSEVLEAVGKINLDAILTEDFQVNAETILLSTLSTPKFEGEEQVYWQALAQRMIYLEIDANEVRDLIKGQTLGSAINLIDDNYDLNSSPKIKLIPSWWPVLPFVPLRITIILE